MNIIIAGLGQLGAKLANDLSKENYNVTVVDCSEKKINRLVETLDVQGVTGSATHCDVLVEADVKICDVFISVTPYDENNILACMIAARMGAKNTVARVRNPKYAKQIDFMRRELGINMLINPEFSTALEVFRLVQFPSAIDIETFANGRIDMIEMKVRKDSILCDTKISNIPSKISKKLLICAICRGSNVYIPNGDFVIKEGDSVHFTGSHKLLGKIAKEFLGKKKEKSIKSIMIIGASRIAFYLTTLLISSGKDVIVVEKDEEKCKQLIEHCPKASVIFADGNDHDILLEEGIEKMDAVITLTDVDETNILINLFSKSVNIEKTITLVSNKNLTRILEQFSNDASVSVAETTCDIITQYVRAKSSVNSSYMKTLYKLVDGKVEAIEFVAEDYVKFLDKPLANLKTKDNVLIAAINRKNKILIPNGNDTIQKGDIVVIVSKDYSMTNLNDIIA